MPAIDKTIPIDFTYLKNKELINLNVIGGYEAMPKELQALDWAMMITGIYRLFTIDDIRELLIRLNIIFKDNTPIDNWFTDDYLFRYEVNSVCYNFEPSTLFKYIGIIVSDYTAEGRRSRSEFFNRIPTRARLNTFMIALTDFKVQFSKTDEPIVLHTIEKSNVATAYNPQFNKKTLRHSELLADKIISESPEGLFDGTDELFLNKIKELNYRKALKAVAPCFNYQAIDQSIKDRFLKIILEGLPPVDDLQTERANAIKQIDFIMETAWAYANDFFLKEGNSYYYSSELIPEFDYLRMYNIGDNQGLTGFMRLYKIDRTTHLLKGLFFSAAFKQLREMTHDCF